MTTRNFRDAVEKLAFQKDDTQSLGLLLKSVLLRTDLAKPYPSAKFQGSIFDEFGIDNTQLDENLKRCIELWRRVERSNETRSSLKEKNEFRENVCGQSIRYQSGEVTDISGSRMT